MTIRYLFTLCLLPLFLIIISCSKNNSTSEHTDLTGTWEVDLSHNNHTATLKGEIVFTGNRYVYTWYQPDQAINTKSKQWYPVEMEQGNVIAEEPGVIALLADSYGIPSGSDNNKIEYVIKPSKSNYLIHYDIQDNKLIWMNDNNLDGDFYDSNEKLIYTRMK